MRREPSPFGHSPGINEPERLRSVMAALSMALILAIGAIFSSSSVAKAFDFGGFCRVLQFALRLKRSHAYMLGTMVLFGEAAVAMIGFAHAVSKLAFYLDLVLGIVLLAAFTWWAVAMLRRRLPVNCPCFGGRGAQLSWRTVARNMTILALATAAGATSARGQAVSSDRQVILAAGMTALAAGAAAYQFVRPYLLTAQRVHELVAAGNRTEGRAA